MSFASNPSNNRIVWALNEWLKVPGLTSLERQVIEMLRDRARVGEFEAAKRELTAFGFKEILSAITKARMLGFLRNWEGFNRAA